MNYPEWSDDPYKPLSSMHVLSVIPLQSMIMMDLTSTMSHSLRLLGWHALRKKLGHGVDPLETFDLMSKEY